MAGAPTDRPRRHCEPCLRRLPFEVESDYLPIRLLASSFLPCGNRAGDARGVLVLLDHLVAGGAANNLPGGTAGNHLLTNSVDNGTPGGGPRGGQGNHLPANSLDGATRPTQAAGRCTGAPAPMRRAEGPPPMATPMQQAATVAAQASLTRMNRQETDEVGWLHGEDVQRRPPFGMPKGIVLLATPEGWCHSVLTEGGGTLCGRLTGVPAETDLAEAQAAVAAVVVGLAHDFHEADVDVAWDPPREPGSWTARAALAAPPRDDASR